MKRLYIMCGIPGAGKSEWLSRNANTKDDIVISRDKIRFAMMQEGDKYFAHEREVYDEYIRQIQEALDDYDGPDNIYCDATHISEKSRIKLLNRLIFNKPAKLYCYVIQVALDTALDRNSERSGKKHVPEEVIRRMCYGFDPPEEDQKYTYDVRYIINE